MGAVKNVKDFIFTENTANGEVRRTSLIVKINALIMCVYFLLLIISFFGVENYFIPVSSTICFVAFLLLFYSISPKSMRQIRFFQSILTLLFIVLFVIMYGWWGGIQQFILSTVVMLYTTGDNPRKRRILYIVGLGVFRLSVYLYSLHIEALATVPKGATIYFQVLNTLAVYVMIAVSLGVYVTDCRELERQLEVSQQNNQLSQMIDLLTGLFNRKAITQQLRDVVATAEVTGEDLSIALLEVDDFGMINITHGQSEGDIILRQVGHQMKELLSERGLIGRWSGTSFLMILDGLSRKEAIEFLSLLQDNIQNMEFFYQHSVIKLTLTISFQEYIRDKDLNESLAQAEKKLKKGKESGGNTIVDK
jgi:diguanylate cyclase (GGDEF)-like protein